MYETIRFNRQIATIVSAPTKRPYEGPGDIVSGAVGWWGLRAYSKAKIGSNTVRLRRSSDNAEQDFATLSPDGGLDPAAITSWAGASVSIFVVKLYDQAGSTNLEQTTGSSQPLLYPTGWRDTKPTMGYAGVMQNGWLATASAYVPASYPFTICGTQVDWFGPTDGAHINLGYSVDEAGALFGLGYSGQSNQKSYMIQVSGANTALVDSNSSDFKSYVGVFDGANSIFNINGSDNSTTIATSAFPVGRIHIGSSGMNSRVVNTEMGLWLGAFNSAQRAAMYSNVKIYWGPDLVQPYVGPGDIAQTHYTTAWWGLRAFGSFTRGMQTVRLRRSSDNAEQDFATLSDGTLDVDSIATFKGAANLFVVKLYNQHNALAGGTSSGIDLPQTTAANQPGYSSTGGPNSKPALVFTAASTHHLSYTGGVLASSPPWTYSAVVRSDNNSAQQVLMLHASGGNNVPQWLFNPGGTNANKLRASDLTAVDVTCNDGATHSIHTIFNSTSSHIRVDSTVTGPSNLGSTAASGTFWVGHDAFGSLNGTLMELGVMGTAFTLTDVANIDDNQRAFWGL